MKCEYCGKSVPDGEQCRCVRHQGRPVGSGGNNTYQSGRNRREQELCKWALETGWTGSQKEWSELCNKRAGNICGPKGQK